MIAAKARLEAIGAVYSAHPDKSVRWLAEQFKRDSSTVHVALQQLGLKPPIKRGAGRSTPVGGRYLLRLTPSQVQEAAELYERGHSCRRIGALYGLSYRTVCDALKRHGVAMRLPASDASHVA
jgi:DNA-binding MarR family transcriptional regulator